VVDLFHGGAGPSPVQVGDALSDEVPTVLAAFDRFLPIRGGWFRQPGPTKAQRLALLPFRFHGIGAFRRRISGWIPPEDSPVDHPEADVARWNHATVALIGT
jgi:hypothetical protein